MTHWDRYDKERYHRQRYWPVQKPGMSDAMKIFLILLGLWIFSGIVWGILWMAEYNNSKREAERITERFIESMERIPKRR